jgi:hypothetical protein
MKGSDISKILKMIYEALFSPSPKDELYKPLAILPSMIFYYLVTIIVVVLYLVLNYILRFRVLRATDFKIFEKTHAALINIKNFE